MTSLALAPANLSLVCVAGDDFPVSFTITEDGSAYDWTGASCMSTIVTLDGAPAAVSSFTLATPTNGTLTATLTDVQTETLGPSVHRYAITVTKSSITRTLLAGTLSVMEVGYGGASSSSATLNISTGDATIAVTGQVTANPVVRNMAPAVTASGDSNGVPTYPQVVLIGDSITANNTAETTWTGTSLSRTNSYRADGYWSRAMVTARQPVSWLNVGTSGDTTTMMLARFDTDVTPLRPQIVVEAGGTNDIRGGVAAATIFANKVAMWNKAYAFGAKVIATTVPPASDSSSAERNVCNAVNAMIREYARTNAANFALVDWFADYVDPLTGGIKASVMDADGIHPNSQGTYNTASKFANAVLQFIGTPADPLPSDNIEDLDNIMNLPLLTGTTGSGAGGWSGVNASGWFCSGTATTSKVARTDGLGDWLQMVCTGSGATNLKSTSTRFAVGDFVYAACEFETDASGWVDGAVTLKLLCFLADGTTAVHFASALSNGADATVLGRHASGILRTPIIQVPASTASMRVDLQKVNAGTVRFGRVEVRKVV